MAELRWEPIPEEGAYPPATSARLWVPGGWIVRVIVSRMDAGAHCSQIFVPDPGHEWASDQAPGIIALGEPLT